MPVRARQWLRRMRGGAQAHLIEADNGHFYVLKAKNNPQHRRILVNEWIASVLLRFLQIEAAPGDIIEVSSAFIESNPEFCIQLGSRQIPIEPGWHFGSRFPGDPTTLAVFDFLPDVLLAKVANAYDFLQVYAFDKWVANADARQAIFYRAKLRQPRDDEHPAPPRTGFVAWMIDHGFAFDGPNWQFNDSALQALYHRPAVYRDVRSFDAFEPALSRIEHFPESVLDEALKQIPREWLPDGDDTHLETLLERLLTRRKRVRPLIEDAARNARTKLFPNWTA
ncbi:MAG: hypothetical protein IT168_13255 [Bryobacterales bacterium]|nr:hypothetical protein [Bryobacterales bacterium]